MLWFSRLGLDIVYNVHIKHSVTTAWSMSPRLSISVFHRTSRVWAAKRANTSKSDLRSRIRELRSRNIGLEP